MPHDHDKASARKRSLRIQPIYMELNADETITEVIFSPEYPDTAVVLLENQPPRIFDLRLSATRDAFQLAKRGRHGAEGWFDESTQIKTAHFVTPALHAAYRPSLAERPEELALVFGEGDSSVARFQPRFGTMMPPLEFQEGSRLSYSAEGDMLAVGSVSGTVSAFDLNQPGTAVKSTEFNGAIRAICMQDAHNVHAATDRNSLYELRLSDPEGEDTSLRHLLPTGQDAVKGIKLNTIAWSQRHRLLAFAGIGNDVWVLNPDAESGRPCRLSGFTKVLSLQFSEDRNELLAFGDNGGAIISYSLDADSLPVFADTVVGLHFPDAEMPARMVAMHQYGNLVCIVNAVPPA